MLTASLGSRCCKAQSFSIHVPGVGRRLPSLNIPKPRITEQNRAALSKTPSKCLALRKSPHDPGNPTAIPHRPGSRSRDQSQDDLAIFIFLFIRGSILGRVPEHARIDPRICWAELGSKLGSTYIHTSCLPATLSAPEGCPLVSPMLLRLPHTHCSAVPIKLQLLSL